MEDKVALSMRRYDPLVLGVGALTWVYWAKFQVSAAPRDNLSHNFYSICRPNTPLPCQLWSQVPGIRMGTSLGGRHSADTPLTQIQPVFGGAAPVWQASFTRRSHFCLLTALGGEDYHRRDPGRPGPPVTFRSLGALLPSFIKKGLLYGCTGIDTNITRIDYILLFLILERN